MIIMAGSASVFTNRPKQGIHVPINLPDGQVPKSQQSKCHAPVPDRVRRTISCVRNNQGLAFAASAPSGAKAVRPPHLAQLRPALRLPAGRKRTLRPLFCFVLLSKGTTRRLLHTPCGSLRMLAPSARTKSMDWLVVMSNPCALDFEQRPSTRPPNQFSGGSCHQGGAFCGRSCWPHAQCARILRKALANKGLRPCAFLATLSTRKAAALTPGLPSRLLAASRGTSPEDPGIAPSTPSAPSGAPALP